MTKISNVVAYSIVSQISNQDYVIGTRGEPSNKPTHNFSMQGIATFVASTLTPEQGGTIKVTEIDIDTLVTDISTTVNMMSPAYEVASYEIVFFMIEGVVYVLKVANVTIGVGGATLTNEDFITFPINTGSPGLNADMTRLSVSTNTITSSGTLSFNFTESSLNLGWNVGTRLRISKNISNYMEGTITSLTSAYATILVDSSKGSGTYNSWKLGIAGDKGIDGNGIETISLISINGIYKTYRIHFTDGTDFEYVVQDGTNGLNANMTRTSSTSNTIANSGSKTFVYTASNNLGWLVGTRLRFSNSTGNYMEGVITAVSATQVTATMDNSAGSGTYSSWNISIAGDKGIDANTVALQKIITYPGDFTAGNYNLSNADNGYTIIIANGSTAVTITVGTALTAKFSCLFIQQGSGNVTFVESGTTINTPVGLLIKGQNYAVAIEKKASTNEFFLLGNTKT